MCQPLRLVKEGHLTVYQAVIQSFLEGEYAVDTPLQVDIEKTRATIYRIFRLSNSDNPSKTCLQREFSFERL